MLEYILLFPERDLLVTNSYVFMAFSFAISIIALSFMAGEFMSMPSLKGFAKVELYELGVSAVILVLLFLFIMPGGPFDLVGQGFMAANGATAPKLCSEWKNLHGGDPTRNAATGAWSMPDGANIVFGQANFFLGCKPSLSSIKNGEFLFVDGVMTSRLLKGYTSLMLTQMFTGFLAGFSTSIQIPVFKVLALDVGLYPWVALGPLNQAHTTMVDLIGTAFAAFTAQNMLLKFIEKAFPVFIAFGLMLRAFPFTRKTGSTVIAVMVAAYFVYPVSILINEQIWISIVAPEGPPGCVAIGVGCVVDKDCCSYNCRENKTSKVGTLLGSTSTGKQCMSPLTEFSEYQSLYSICNDAVNDAKINETLKRAADEQDARLLELYFSGDPSETEENATKPESRLSTGLGAMLSCHAKAFGAFSVSLLNPLPGPVAQIVFAQIEMLVMDTAQYVMLAMIFVVMSIVISLTLLKDIAILLGGEPRIFGISKLV